jgi:hypothetical protein
MFGNTVVAKLGPVTVVVVDVDVEVDEDVDVDVDVVDEIELVVEEVEDVLVLLDGELVVVDDGALVVVDDGALVVVDDGALVVVLVEPALVVELDVEVVLEDPALVVVEEVEAGTDVVLAAEVVVVSDGRARSHDTRTASRAAPAACHTSLRSAFGVVMKLAGDSRAGNGLRLA